jgi:hypothetical protein
VSGDINADGVGLIASRLAPTRGIRSAGVVQNAGISKGIVQNKTGPMPSCFTQPADLKAVSLHCALA